MFSIEMRLSPSPGAPSSATPSGSAVTGMVAAAVLVRDRVGAAAALDPLAGGRQPEDVVAAAAERHARRWRWRRSPTRRRPGSPRPVPRGRRVSVPVPPTNPSPAGGLEQRVVVGAAVERLRPGPTVSLSVAGAPWTTGVNGLLSATSSSSPSPSSDLDERPADGGARPSGRDERARTCFGTLHASALPPAERRGDVVLREHDAGTPNATSRSFARVRGRSTMTGVPADRERPGPATPGAQQRRRTDSTAPNTTRRT